MGGDGWVNVGDGSFFCFPPLQDPMDNFSQSPLYFSFFSFHSHTIFFLPSATKLCAKNFSFCGSSSFVMHTQCERFKNKFSLSPRVFLRLTHMATMHESAWVCSCAVLCFLLLLSCGWRTLFFFRLFNGVSISFVFVFYTLYLFSVVFRELLNCDG